MTTIQITLFGITQCDTVKKSRQWFETRELAYAFHDFKKLGVPPELWVRWTQQLPPERLINRQGTTWRKLDPDIRQAIENPALALVHVQANTSVIKRPVVEMHRGDSSIVTIGFAPDQWQAFLEG